jgi:energy-converting hydrogenase A subunit M
MIDDLHRQLAEALRDITVQYRNCIIYSGTDAEYADIAVQRFRDVLSKYDSVLYAEHRAAEQATAKLLGTDEDGQFGMGA